MILKVRKKKEKEMNQVVIMIVLKDLILIEED